MGDGGGGVGNVDLFRHVIGGLGAGVDLGEDVRTWKTARTGPERRVDLGEDPGPASNRASGCGDCDPGGRVLCWTWGRVELEVKRIGKMCKRR